MSFAIAAGPVPIVNVPAGTQTCWIPYASVRTWPAVVPSEGTGVGGTEATADAAAVVAALGAELAADESVAVDVAADGGLVGVTVTLTEPAQPATVMLITSVAALERRAFCSRNIERCYPRLALRRPEDPETAR